MAASKNNMLWAFGGFAKRLAGLKVCFAHKFGCLLDKPMVKKKKERIKNKERRKPHIILTTFINPVQMTTISHVFRDGSKTQQLVT